MTTEPKEAASAVLETLKMHAEADDQSVIYFTPAEARALLRALSAEPGEPEYWEVEEDFTSDGVGWIKWSDAVSDREEAAHAAIRPVRFTPLYAAPQPAPLGFSEWRKRAEELVDALCDARCDMARTAGDLDTWNQHYDAMLPLAVALSAHLDAHPSGVKVERGEYERLRLELELAASRFSPGRGVDLFVARDALDTLLAPVLTAADAEEEG